MNTVLILGATGRFGRNCVTAFETAGWQVRKYRRGTDMAKAAMGADVIVNGLNPPYQTDWQALLPPMAREIVSAAKASGATILQAGNVYGFGSEGGTWGPDTPMRATTGKGKARIEMEHIFRQAAAQGVQTIILRAGDFIDTKPSGNYFDLMVAKLHKGRLSYPGRTDIERTWAFLPDMARAAAMLAERRKQLAGFEDIPFAGYTLTGQELREALQTASGRKVTFKPFPWWFFKLAAPVSKLFKALLEMRYLWNTPHRLDGSRLAEVLPDYRGTELVTALRLAVNKTEHPPASPIAQGG